MELVDTITAISIIQRPCLHHCLKPLELLKHEFKELRDWNHGPWTVDHHMYTYIDNYTYQSLILLTTISCLLGAIQWITKMPINVFRQSRCLNTSDSICDLFKWVCDRNDRNDKGNGKSYVRANDRGLQISCYFCH